MDEGRPVPTEGGDTSAQPAFWAWSRRVGAWMLGMAGWGTLAVLGCGDLAEPPDSARDDPRLKMVLRANPPLAEGLVPPVVHFLVSGLPRDAEPSPMLLEGHATSRNLRDLAEDDAGQSLRDRIVATTTWTGDDGIWYVVPHEALGLGDKYSVVAPTVRWSETVDVIDEDETSILSRVWPPEAQPGMVGLWCPAGPVAGAAPRQPTPRELLPGVAGTLDWGAFEGIGQGCVRWRADLAVGRHVVAPPVLCLPDGREVRMDPSPVLVDHGDAGAVPPCCGAGQHVQGPACVKVLDDRAIVSVCGAPWLVGLELGTLQVARVVEPDEPWVVRPLPPESSVDGTMLFLSSGGQVERDDVSWRTSSSSPHVVINEVMANPAGPEPDQEWVELYNDGTGEVFLGGWRLEDAGGATELPAATVVPGEYVLIVGEGYDASSWVDTSPASGTALLRVERLGKSGLSNAGEPLRLVRADGQTASSVPAIPSKDQGVSVVRMEPGALDEVPASFGFGGDGGTPGWANAVGVDGGDGMSAD